MKILMRDPEGDAGAGDGADANKAPAFDAQAFKNEVLESNRSMMEQVMGMVNVKLDALKTVSAPPVIANQQGAITDDIRSDVEALGLDGNTAQALINIIDKSIGKKAPEYEGKILNRVDQTLENKERVAEYETRIKTQYPGFYDEGSPLRKQTQIEFNEMSPESRKQADAAYNAVARAAGKLGITASSLNSSRANAGQTVAGNGDPNSAPKSKQKDAEFAAFFNVDVKRFGQLRDEKSKVF